MWENKFQLFSSKSVVLCYSTHGKLTQTPSSFGCVVSFTEDLRGEMRQRGTHILALCPCCFTGSLFHAHPVSTSFLPLKSPNSKSILPYDAELQLSNSAPSPPFRPKPSWFSCILCMKILCKDWQPLSEGRCGFKESHLFPCWETYFFSTSWSSACWRLWGRFLYLHPPLECSGYGL